MAQFTMENGKTDYTMAVELTKAKGQNTKDNSKMENSQDLENSPGHVDHSLKGNSKNQWKMAKANSPRPLTARLFKEYGKKES